MDAFLPPALTQADLIFPQHAGVPKLSSTLSSLRRSDTTMHKRLRSIVKDSLFVTRVSLAYGLPLVANERCGSWYVPPALKTSSVYFKSTDGHDGQWKFSLRRLNLQLLDVVREHGGAVVVDSTTRGKAMPDALRSTVPIWCCVINRAVFGEEKSRLATAPEFVSESQHAQMEASMDGWVRDFLAVCKANLPELRAKLQKPLQPIWVRYNSPLPEVAPCLEDVYPVVLCTASRRLHGAERPRDGYIQGAADDHESWAGGLTPTLFWENKHVLLNTNEEELPDLIQILASQKTTRNAVSTRIQPTTTLYISESEGVDLTSFHIVVSCTPAPFPPHLVQKASIKHHLHLACGTGKLGSRDLRSQLPRLMEFFSSITPDPSSKILLCCPTGKDLSVGTALAILCLYADDNGTIRTQERRRSAELNKVFIKQRLSWISTSNPALNPSRSTLQSVNAVLLEHAHPKLSKESNPPTSHANIPSNIPSNMSFRPPYPSTQPNPPAPSLSSIPSLLFHSLPTTPWHFTRTLTSALSTHPSGIVTGTASFTHMDQPSGTPTLLYAEQGEFVTTTGLKFRARRKYVYQLEQRPPEAKTGYARAGGHEDRANTGEHEDDGAERYMSVYFANDDPPGPGLRDASAALGGLFVQMDAMRFADGTYTAANVEQHLCGEDVYVASWTFSEAMGKLGGGREEKEHGNGGVWWQVRYQVKGPSKDYVGCTRYMLA